MFSIHTASTGPSFHAPVHIFFALRYMSGARGVHPFSFGGLRTTDIATDTDINKIQMLDIAINLICVYVDTYCRYIHMFTYVYIDRERE